MDDLGRGGDDGSIATGNAGARYTIHMKSNICNICNIHDI